MTSPALRARLTSWIDMMLSPPEREEVVVDADPLQPQHLGKQRAQDLLLRRARRRAAPSSASGPAPAAPAVELAVRRQRQPIQHHKRRRHHVVRQGSAQDAPAAQQHPTA